MSKSKMACALSATVMTLGASVLAPAAWATSSEDFMDCLHSAESECVLSGDVEMNSLYQLDRDLTINLKGHNITSATTAKFFETRGHALTITGEGSISTTDTTNTGIVRVYGTGSVDAAERTSVTIGKDVTLNGPNPIVVYNTGVTAYNTTIDIYGTLNGHNSGIWMIGTIADKTNYPTINIHDGAVVAADDPIVDAEHRGGVAISAMGYARWNIDEATITGVGSGIGVKGGIVDIDGASVTATGDPSVLPPELYNNGINPSGAAIQVEKNAGYPGDIELNIVAGDFTSEYNDAVIYEYGEADAVKSIEVSGGTFNAEPAAEYIADGYVAYVGNEGAVYNVLPLMPAPSGEDYTGGEEGNANTVVLTKAASEILATLLDKYATLTDDTDDYLTLETESGTKFYVSSGDAKAILENGLMVSAKMYSSEFEEDGLYDGEREALNEVLVEGMTVYGYIDYSIELGTDGEYYGGVTETPEALTLTYDASDAPVVPEGATRVWKAVRLHFNPESGKYEATIIDAIYDEETRTVVFESDEFSAFAIVYEDIYEEKEEAAVEVTSPETGTMTAAGASASVAAMAAAVAVGVLTSIVSFTYLVRRKD